MLRRALAFTLALGILAASSPPRAAGPDPAVEASAAVSPAAPEFLAPVEAPEKYLKLTWIFEGAATPVYVYSAAQVIAIDLKLQSKDRQIEFLIDKAAKECVDAQIVAASKSSWVWAVVGGVVVGGVATWATLRVVK